MVITIASMTRLAVGCLIAVLILGACVTETDATPTSEPTRAERDTPTATTAPTNTEAEQPEPTDTPAEDTAVSRDGIRLPAEVVEVVDGDTIDVSIDGEVVRVRLLGIDAPETNHPDLGTQCYGPEASDFISQQIPADTAVILESDVTDTDQFDRALRYVWLPDGRMLNLELVFYGMAYASSQEPDTKYEDQIQQTEDDAANDRRGLWGTCVEWPTATPGPTATPESATSTPRPTATPRPAPTATPVPAPPSNCDPSYPGVCIPPYPPDLDCGEISQRNFRVVGSDPHGFDRDNDGIGCEG